MTCPRCGAAVEAAATVCGGCGFPLVEERVASRRGLLLACVALAAAAAAAVALPAALSSRGGSISGAEAERLLALRYPRLRAADHAVIACPRRRIEPGAAARCWVLARVGWQRAVVVRVSPGGDEVEIDD